MVITELDTDFNQVWQCYLKHAFHYEELPSLRDICWNINDNNNNTEESSLYYCYDYLYGQCYWCCHHCTAIARIHSIGV